jgi:hypothetical protein
MAAGVKLSCSTHSASALLPRTSDDIDEKQEARDIEHKRYKFLRRRRFCHSQHCARIYSILKS